MISPTVDDYERAIPKNCKLTTIEEHVDIMLCWGLSRSIGSNTKMNCGWCEFNNEHTDEERKEQQLKERAWRILNNEHR